MRKPSQFADVPDVVRRRMARIRKAGTHPELVVRRIVRALGIGYRLNRKDLPGTPDLVFIGRRKAIFVHGCFWHRHGCKITANIPRTRAEYWGPKLARNVERDSLALQSLAAMGWATMTVWECEIGDPELSMRLKSFLLDQ